MRKETPKRESVEMGRKSVVLFLSEQYPVCKVRHSKITEEEIVVA
jgi:hypothetical protein